MRIAKSLCDEGQHPELPRSGSPTTRSTADPLFDGVDDGSDRGGRRYRAAATDGDFQKISSLVDDLRHVTCDTGWGVKTTATATVVFVKGVSFRILHCTVLSFLGGTLLPRS